MKNHQINACKVGPLKHFAMTNKDRYELKIAGLLHDCGKVTTPVHVVDKGAFPPQVLFPEMSPIASETGSTALIDKAVGES